MKSFSTISFPSVQGFTVVSAYMDVVKQDTLNFLLTNVGQRVIRRTKIGIPLDELLFDDKMDVEGKLSLIKTYIDEFLKNTFVGIVCTYVKEINTQTNLETGKIDIEIMLVDQNLGTVAILTLSNQ